MQPYSYERTGQGALYSRLKQGHMLLADLVYRIERLLSAKLASFRSVAGGYTPARRLVCRTPTTSYFVRKIHVAGHTPTSKLTIFSPPLLLPLPLGYRGARAGHAN